MRFITFRSNGEPDDPNAYWRRRFFILGGGLAVLMLLAWLFGGGGPSKQASQTAAARASAAAQRNRDSLPSAATGQPSPGPSSSASPSATFSPSPSASGTLAAGKAPGKGAGTACAAGRVVLSMFTGQPDYQAGQEPVFHVYAVSTSQSACRMKYGPSAVRILVTQHGKKVWDSAACPGAGAGAQVTTLTPGVPQGVTLTWNPKAHGRCAGTLSPGGSGTFEAMATADGHFSPVRSFKVLAGTSRASRAKPSGTAVSGPSAKSSGKSSGKSPAKR